MFVVLDRDGTLIDHVHYLTKIEQIVVLPEAVRAVRLLNSARIPTVVITNQPVVAKGLISRASLDVLHSHLSQMFKRLNAQLGEFLVCPHQESDLCQCRKPKTQLLRQAAHKFGLQPSSAFVVGDSLRDLELASNVGAQGLHVQTGVLKQPPPHYSTFANLFEAVKVILSAHAARNRHIPGSSSVGIPNE